MFIINDMELLSRLGKHNILNSILLNHSISISAIKLNEYSYMLKKQIQVYTALKTGYADENFDTWMLDKRSNASLGDLSSIYIAKAEDLSIVLSDEDKHLSVIAKACKVMSINFDEFIRRTVKDERMIQIYNLIKRVA
jgi:hypothetical protein